MISGSRALGSAGAQTTVPAQGLVARPASSSVTGIPAIEPGANPGRRTAGRTNHQPAPTSGVRGGTIVRSAGLSPNVRHARRLVRRRQRTVGPPAVPWIADARPVDRGSSATGVATPGRHARGRRSSRGRKETGAGSVAMLAAANVSLVVFVGFSYAVTQIRGGRADDRQRDDGIADLRSRVARLEGLDDHPRTEI